ncbi:MAG: 2Fe-2S iron-sulfur cluster-binding protein, partial [Candidatus Glassbacteria bacterium]
MAKHKIKLLPDGRRLTGRAGSPLLEALTDSGIRVYSPCGGRGLCGSCQVQIAGPGRLVSAEEHRHLSRRQIEEGWRLACRQTLDCDLAVTLTESVDFAQAKIKL